MISLVVRFFNSVADAVDFVFKISCFIGLVIVYLITTAWCVLYSIISNTILFFQIVYEDNRFDELPEFTKEMANELSNEYIIMRDTVSSVYDAIENTVIDAASSCMWTINSTVLMCTEVARMLKNAIVMIGAGLWLIITFIPASIPHGLTAILTMLKKMYTSMLSVTNYLTDVPFESFMGLISTIVIVRLCVSYRHAIESLIDRLCRFFVNKMLYIYYTIYNYCFNTEARYIARIVRNYNDNSIREHTEPEVLPYDDESEGLCVICKERPKSILILPCKHVCMCRECYVRLNEYQRRCPICRTFIYHSITIYL